MRLIELPEAEEINNCSQANIDQEEATDLHPEQEEIPAYFKFTNPTYLQELDWAVTQSKYDFPWSDIASTPFTAKECYEKYSELVTDAQSFFKRVL